VNKWLQDLKRKSENRVLVRRAKPVKFTLEHDYYVTAADRKSPQFDINSKITDLLVRTGVNAKFQQGVKDKGQQELAASVTVMFLQAIEEELEEVDIDARELELVVDAFKEWSVPVQWTPWFVILREYAEKALEEAKTAAKEEKAVALEAAKAAKEAAKAEKEAAKKAKA
jgi:Glu-tRNA(Gln) amidotransferase subunit E-like FAD-binding protein